MRSNSTQFTKEARQLVWPWTMFMLAGLLVLAHRWTTALPEFQMGTGEWSQVSDWILATGAFLGSLLLVVLPLGSEFQYRTLAMRLAQPMDRREFWRQKILVTAATVAPLAVIYCAAMRMRFGWPYAVMVASWIVVAFAGAIPFTLAARSTLGGMVLNNFGTTGVTFGWMYYERHGQFPAVWLWTLGIGLAGYASVMIWLGRRMLLRFQAIDGMQPSEAFVPEALVPRAVTELLRCRPAQPVRNLLRREFHLLRVVWPLTLLYVAAWILLVTFRRLPTNSPESLNMEFVLTIVFGILIAVLAGALSLGEEKTWGTHDWQMTAPVSVSLQWAVKLVVALCTSVVCAVLLPMLVLTLSGITGSGLHTMSATAWIVGAVVITLAAFWCACVVRSTVQATLCVFPLCFAVYLAFESGALPLLRFARPFHHLVVSVVTRLDAIAMRRELTATLNVFSLGNGWAIIGALLLAVCLIQSQRFFRAQVSADKLRVIRCALPLLAVAFLCSFVSEMFVDVLRESWHQQATILRETDSAIAAWQAADPSYARHPQRLSPNDLMKVSPLSSVTQRWLRNASIMVAPAPGRFGQGPGPYFPGRMVFGVRSDLTNRVSYSALVQAANGSRCSLLFDAPKQGAVGFITAICE